MSKKYRLWGNWDVSSVSWLVVGSLRVLWLWGWVVGVVNVAGVASVTLRSGVDFSGFWSPGVDHRWYGFVWSDDGG
ncbi:hypothetical protein, partial [Micromonospora sp. NPDC000668]|uniref:hypothetical protein n=1 Tax=Micromonospora sp. NPDC000668 TaxID=3364219 RepID=UPI0036746D0E